MDYNEWLAICAPDQEQALGEALAAVDCSAFAMSSRTDGRVDVQLWLTSEQPDPRVVGVLQQFGLQLEHQGSKAEAELVNAHLGDEPFPLGGGVWVEPADIPAPAESRLVLRLPPTAAFGDGRHPTTSMAVALLTTCGLADASVLDVGCGTGVLGLVALKSGAQSVAFSDYDADAVRVTHTLLADHEFTECFVTEADLLDVVDYAEVQSQAPFDIVICNIYAELLHVILDDPRLLNVLPVGKQLLLSGISHQKYPELCEHLAERGFEVQAEQEQSWWHALLAKRVR